MKHLSKEQWLEMAYTASLVTMFLVEIYFIIHIFH